MNFITLKSFHEKSVFVSTIHPPRLGHIDMEELKETLEETWIVMAKVVVSGGFATHEYKVGPKKQTVRHWGYEPSYPYL